MNIKVLLADDHKIVRDGLRTLINQQNNMKVIGEAKNGRDAVRLAAEVKPDVDIVDISMPDLNGFDATRQIIVESPKTKVIALSMHSDRKFVTGMLEAEATGYLLKDCAFDELAIAIKSVAAKRTYLSSVIAHHVVKGSSKLSSRECEILQMLSEGKSAKQIASILSVAVKTVETHRRNIMVKLDVDNLAGLVKYAIKEGICTLSM